MDLPMWPRYTYHLMSILVLPLYFMVLTCLLKLRSCNSTYRTTFYTILLQHVSFIAAMIMLDVRAQSIADIFSMLIFIITCELRQTPGIKDIYFQYQEYYLCAISYNNVYYCIYIRCTGIIFLSLHRYLVISAPTHLVTMKVQEAATWQIAAVYWIVPTLISVVVLKDTDFHYDALETMEVVAPRSIITRNTLMCLIIVALTCFVCVASYLAMWYFLRKHTAGFSKSLQREMHLAFQVLALLCAFFVMFAYYVAQNYFSQTQNTGPIYMMRSLYPLANGILSYINPFCILLINQEFGRQFLKFLKCEGKNEMRPTTILSSTQQRSLTNH